MDFGAILLLLSLLILVGLFISRPFFERKKVVVDYETDPYDHERSALLAERDRVLSAIKELDFDYAMRKITEDEYWDQRNLLMQDGANILRQLDTLQDSPPKADVDKPSDDTFVSQSAVSSDGAVSKTEELELAAASAPVSVFSPKTNSSSHQDPDDELEVMLANRRRERQEKSVGFCPQCGGALRESDRFCPKCGASID
jgi:hypothetical protein